LSRGVRPPDLSPQHGGGRRCPDISFHPMRMLIDGHDREGTMILADGQPVVVIVQLDAQSPDPEHEGLWKLEAGFGKCAVGDA
jgi:hypothetical protein